MVRVVMMMMMRGEGRKEAGGSASANVAEQGDISHG